VNTNLIHNILNLGMVAVALVTVPEFVALFPPEVGLKIVAAAATLKTTLNVWRDGLTGLVKVQPPVK
jgi:hypothetical protein